MTAPLFSGEGPQYYDAAYRHNAPFAKPGPYQTRLPPAMEAQYRRWVKDNNVNTDPNESRTDYDMRGYWQAMQRGGERAGREPGGGVGYPDTYKTPYDTTFSRESEYATANCPFVWQGNNLVDTRNGQLIFGRGPAPVRRQGGGGVPKNGGGPAGYDPTKVVPSLQAPTQIGDLTSGVVPVDEWRRAPPGMKRAFIYKWVGDALRAEGIDPNSMSGGVTWQNGMLSVISHETGAPGAFGTGDPNAINMYDSNWPSAPSIGLAQVIGPTAAMVGIKAEQLTDPVMNVRAAIRAIKVQHEGDLANVPEAHGAHIGYQQGGPVGLAGGGFPTAEVPGSGTDINPVPPSSGDYPVDPGQGMGPSSDWLPQFVTPGTGPGPGGGPGYKPGDAALPQWWRDLVEHGGPEGGHLKAPGWWIGSQWGADVPRGLTPRQQGGPAGWRGEIQHANGRVTRFPIGMSEGGPTPQTGVRLNPGERLRVYGPEGGVVQEKFG